MADVRLRVEAASGAPGADPVLTLAFAVLAAAKAARLAGGTARAVEVALDHVVLALAVPDEALGGVVAQLTAQVATRAERDGTAAVVTTLG